MSHRNRSQSVARVVSLYTPLWVGRREWGATIHALVTHQGEMGRTSTSVRGRNSGCESLQLLKRTRR